MKQRPTTSGSGPVRGGPPGDFFTVHRGDSRQLQEFLQPYSSAEHPLLTATITSPPYWNLKDYQHPDQVGFGSTYEDYLEDSRRIFRVLASHTKGDGCMWLVADTLLDRRKSPSKLHPLPFQLAQQATIAGWVLKDVIVWNKEKTLPWSGRGRLRNAFEYILYFVKSDKFKYYVDRLRDPVRLEKWWVQYPERYNPQGKVPTNIWTMPIPVQGSWSNTAIQHACPLPPDLVERMLLLSTDGNDVVIDPFAGSGVVVAEAERLGRRGIGVELVDAYVEAFHGLVRPEILQRRGRDELAERLQRGVALQETILKLRALKYPRVLCRQLDRSGSEPPRIQAVFAEVMTSDPSVLLDRHKIIECRITFVADGDSPDRERLARAAKDVAARPPASKFGVTGEIRVLSASELETAVATGDMTGNAGNWHLYVNGRTWRAHEVVASDHLGTLLETEFTGRFPPILGNVFVSETPRELIE